MTKSEDRILETQIYSILDENKNVIPATLTEWSNFHKNSPFRWVEVEIIHSHLIYSAFVGIDHGFPSWPGHEKDHRLGLFVTRVFKGSNGQEIYKDGYSRWDEAEKGHDKAIEWVKNVCKSNNIST